MASISAARAFGLRDRGLVAPGWRADLVLLDDLEALRRLRRDQRRPARRRRRFSRRAAAVAPVGRRSVKARPVAAADFACPRAGPRHAGHRRDPRQDHHASG